MRLRVSGDVRRDAVVRSEGGVSMTLVEPELTITCQGVNFRTLHPDVLALIGVLAFHPVMPDGEFVLSTGFPVSPTVEAALRRPWILPGITVRSDGVSSPYEPQRAAVLSYGGGFDSLAAHLLFPDVALTHETPLPARNGAPSMTS